MIDSTDLMLPSKIGYAAINNSCEDFRPQLQLLEQRGCEKIYQDIAPTIDSERLGLAEMMLEIESKKSIQIYCRDFRTMFSRVGAFVPIAELIIENNSSLIFLEDNITISDHNGSEFILMWLDLLEFKTKHRGRRISKKNRKINKNIS
ncbi:MAG: recombinase family protein [bacterium]|nr:recombinase family protein [bacterium]